MTMASSSNKAHDIRLILTDIDGTILPYGQAVVSVRTRQAFHAAQDAGIHVGPASGRGFSHIPASFAGDESCSATCLATNGMQVYLDGNLVHQARLPREAVLTIEKLCEGIPGAGLLFFVDGEPRIATGELADLAIAFPMYARETTAELHPIPPHDIEKANVFVASDMDATRAVFDRLWNKVEGIDFNIPMAGFLNMMPTGWNKASGIDVLCDAMGIGLDQVVVFGDGGNDVEMLEHVPHSAAVAGADPKAAAAARYHIGACEDEAVSTAIEALAAGEWPFS